MQRLKELEKTLQANVTKARELGWTVDRGFTFFPRQKLCSALGSLVVCGLVERDESLEWLPEKVGSFLGMSEAEIESFEGGFHGDCDETGKNRCFPDHIEDFSREFFLLGKKVRKF